MVQGSKHLDILLGEVGGPGALALPHHQELHLHLQGYRDDLGNGGGDHGGDYGVYCDLDVPDGPGGGGVPLALGLPGGAGCRTCLAVYYHTPHHVMVHLSNPNNTPHLITPHHTPHHTQPHTTSHPTTHHITPNHNPHHRAPLLFITYHVT